MCREQEFALYSVVEADPTEIIEHKYLLDAYGLKSVFKQYPDNTGVLQMAL